jgi:hypothetical protein
MTPDRDLAAGLRHDPLHAVVGEVETHVAEAGWDQPRQLFALVETEALLRAEPQLARTMGLVPGPPGSLTPIAQEPLGSPSSGAPLDEALARIVFGTDVLGVVLVHEVLVLPPSAEAALRDRSDVDLADAVAEHPDRREVRMCVGVVRGGARACVLRLRGQAGPDSATEGAGEDERVTGPDLAPALADALLATLDG